MPTGLVEARGEPDRVRELDPGEGDPERGVAVGAAESLPRQRQAEQPLREAMRCLRGEREQDRPRQRPVQSQPRSIGSLCYARCPDDLAQRLIAASELHGDFVLSSGRRSNVYFDKFRFLTDPTLLSDTAKAVAELLPDGITHLAAPEGAATLLVAAVALETGLPVAIVRKEPKAYGTMSQVEGHAPAGAVIALIEDVSTTGPQVRSAAKVLEAAGCNVGIIVLAIDRGGAEHLREVGYRVKSVVEVRPSG